MARTAAPFITRVIMSRTSEVKYTPAWWVPGGHLQTLWGKLARRVPVVPTRAERWATPDGDEIEIRRLDPPDAGPSDTPRLLILHGLEGTIRSHYLSGLLDQARRRGWPADILIFRGCNGEMNRVPRLYHSGETTDLDFVVRRLIAEEPERRIVLAGVSLGGNVLLKWLGEQGCDIPGQVCAAAAVSVPFDLEAGARRIEQGFSRIYTWHFLRTLRAKAMRKLARFPGLFDAVRLQDARTLFDFDDAVTAPIHGFEGAHDYYSRSSSLPFLSAIRVPVLLLSARDDPFLPPEVLDSVALVARNSDVLRAELHSRGGHVGFVSGTMPWRTHYYAEERVLNFLAGSVRAGAGSAVSTCAGREG